MDPRAIAYLNDFMKENGFEQQLDSNIADVSSATGAENDLYSFSVPASTLKNNKDTLHIVAHGTFAANGNNKQVKLKLGTATLLDSGTLTLNNKSWKIEAWVTRVDATHQIAVAVGTFDTTVLVSSTKPTLTLSGALAAKCTAIANSGAADIVQNGQITKMSGSK